MMNDSNQENFNRDFKGVWITKEVWLDKRLNALDKIILTEIDSLDQGEEGCFASNEYIATFCQCSSSKVSASISKLIKYGYLFVFKFDGRKRYLKSRLSNFNNQPSKICKADYENLEDINIDNKIDNNIINSKEDAEPKVNKTKLIKEVIDYMNNCGELEDNFKIKKTFNYNPKAKSNITIITARINEGNTLDDFKDVIYHTYEKFVENEFKGLNGKPSIQYYRPSTLFASENMEKYKNEYRNL